MIYDRLIFVADVDRLNGVHIPLLILVDTQFGFSNSDRTLEEGNKCLNQQQGFKF